MLSWKQTIIILVLSLATAGVCFAQLTPIEELGKALFFDTNLSTPPGQSCATCHAPEVGFTGPDSYINDTQVAYPGAVHTRAGNRKPPTSAYGEFSPVMYYDEDEELIIGGMFWDGRATGWSLGDPLAEQAQGPFLNPLEQNNPNAKFVLQRVAQSDYADLFEEVWGPGSLDPVNDTIGSYERLARSISAYEASTEVNPFTSKFDYYMAGMAELTDEEAFGLELFEGKALCSACHISEPSEDGAPPLFTDFTYDNLGIPANHDLAIYGMPRKWNADGLGFVDLGLGGFLAHTQYSDLADENLGKFKVPTLRNVDLRPYPEFVKAYGHNGFFKSLEEITHFYNTRDVEAWPEPEYPYTVNSDELGNLGLTAEEEAALVAFMKTLSDGYMPVPGEKSAAVTKVSLAVSRSVGADPDFRFTLPASGHVKFEVFDIRGYRVTTLEDARLGAGEHRYTMPVSGLNSGLYLARLMTDHEIATAKFTVVK